VDDRVIVVVKVIELVLACVIDREGDILAIEVAEIVSELVIVTNAVREDV
jgi:DNA topoisomerase IA